MKLLGKKLLCEFKGIHTDARSQIDSWETEIEKYQWDTPIDLKRRYPKASILKSRNVIFNICGNDYRIWAKIDYKNKIVLVKLIGTHKEYDTWEII